MLDLIKVDLSFLQLFHAYIQSDRQTDKWIDFTRRSIIGAEVVIIVSAIIVIVILYTFIVPAYFKLLVCKYSNKRTELN
jgi:riboflavin transporter FmnP